MKVIRYRDAIGEWRWTAVARNGKKVCDSAEGYLRKSDCNKGIDAVKHGIPGAEIEDAPQPA